MIGASISKAGRDWRASKRLSPTWARTLLLVGIEPKALVRPAPSARVRLADSIAKKPPGVMVSAPNCIFLSAVTNTGVAPGGITPPAKAGALGGGSTYGPGRATRTALRVSARFCEIAPFIAWI